MAISIWINLNNSLLSNQVFLLVHMFEVKLQGVQTTKTDTQNAVVQSDTKELLSGPEIHLNSGGLPNLSPDGLDGSEANAHSNDYEKKDDKGIEGSSVIDEEGVNDSANGSSGKILEKIQAGAHWDIFRREDIPKLMEYISMHWTDFGKADNINDDYVSHLF